MNPRLESLAREKELLLASSAVCRLRLGLQARELRGALRWKQAAAAAVTAPATRFLALNLAVSMLGLGRAARWVMLAGRIVLAAKLARSIALAAVVALAGFSAHAQSTSPSPNRGVLT